MIRHVVSTCLLSGIFVARAVSEPWSPEVLRADIARLKPTGVSLADPKPGEWRTITREHGETFAEWLSGSPVTADTTRKFIYVQPIGKFTPDQRRIVDLAAEHLGIFYGTAVRTLPAKEFTGLPRGAKRERADGTTQFLTGYILDYELRPALPKDAVFLVAFTAEDLWPGNDWNFVFGMAHLKNRVGVWSIKRFGDASGTPEERRRVLRRAIKVATHESGHMFSIVHCDLFRCGMNGANSLPEADAQPLEFCPECLAKVAFATKQAPRVRLAALRDWYRKNGFKTDADGAEARLATLAGKTVSEIHDPAAP